MVVMEDVTEEERSAELCVSAAEGRRKSWLKKVTVKTGESQGRCRSEGCGDQQTRHLTN